MHCLKTLSGGQDTFFLLGKGMCGSPPGVLKKKLRFPISFPVDEACRVLDLVDVAMLPRIGRCILCTTNQKGDDCSVWHAVKLGKRPSRALACPHMHSAAVVNEHDNYVQAQCNEKPANTNHCKSY